MEKVLAHQFQEEAYRSLKHNARYRNKKLYKDDAQLLVLV